MSSFIQAVGWLRSIDRRAGYPVAADLATEWPPARLQGQDRPLMGSRYDNLPRGTGNTRWLQITGVTKDATGTPLGGVTVQAFRTSDDAFISQTVSDAQGVYAVGVDSAVAHYVVGFIAGAPNRAGGSDNTLVGS